MRYYLKYTVIESSEVEFSMYITKEDAKLLESMDDDARAEWIQDQTPNYDTGLYDECRCGECILDSDPPRDVKIMVNYHLRPANCKL